MNSVRVIGNMVKEMYPYNKRSYLFEVRRSGKKEVFDKIFVILEKAYTLDELQAYEITGKIGVKSSLFTESGDDLYIDCKSILVWELPLSEEDFRTVNITGHIINKYRNPKNPGKIIVTLKSEDDPNTKFRVVAWGERAEYLDRKNPEILINLFGELVTYRYQTSEKGHIVTEIAFWYIKN